MTMYKPNIYLILPSFDSRNYRHGQSRPRSAAPFRPAYCDLDKKVLRFFAYFVEDVGGGESGDRVVRRVRHVHVMYFLEDDTISVIEPRVKVMTADSAVQNISLMMSSQI